MPVMPHAQALGTKHCLLNALLTRKCTAASVAATLSSGTSLPLLEPVVHTHLGPCEPLIPRRLHASAVASLEALVAALDSVRSFGAVVQAVQEDGVEERVRAVGPAGGAVSEMHRHGGLRDSLHLRA